MNYFLNNAVGRGIVVSRSLVSCCGSMFCVGSVDVELRFDLLG
jgi:hypothetical protein